MKGKGPRHERETIINFNEEEPTASIWTASETVYRRLLKRLGKDYLTEDGGRHAIFTFAKDWISPPRPKRPPTEAQKQFGKRMRQAILSQEPTAQPRGEPLNGGD
jgi:hypothetical protein